MRHHIKQEPTIVLELSKEEFEHILSATLLKHSDHKDLHNDHLRSDYKQELSEAMAIKLEEIYKSIK